MVMKQVLRGSTAMSTKRLKYLNASMTLEASIALPLFIFFFLNIMSAIWIIQIQSDLEAVLHQTGSEITKLAFDIREGEELLGKEADDPGLAEMVALSMYVVSQVKSSMEDKLKNNPIMGGTEGLSFLSTKIMQEGDIVDIVVDYKVHPIAAIVGFGGFGVQSRYYGHAWTGYEISSECDEDAFYEEMVHITEHGEVYHKDIACRHLKSDVRSTGFEDVPHQRNADGSKYYPCEYCGEGVCAGNVFITTYGTRYHSRIDCPSLKRKIYTIPISEVGGRRPCSACGG